MYNCNCVACCKMRGVVIYTFFFSPYSFRLFLCTCYGMVGTHVPGALDLDLPFILCKAQTGIGTSKPKTICQGGINDMLLRDLWDVVTVEFLDWVTQVLEVKGWGEDILNKNTRIRHQFSFLRRREGKEKSKRPMF